MSVTVDEILNAARLGAAALTGETAGYLLLGAADRLPGGSGRLVSSTVLLAEDGSLAVLPLAAGSALDLEADLRSLLGRMLSHCRQGVPALGRVAQPLAEPRGLLRLVGEIEAALIPVNRSAARRALSRLHRDVVRARDAGKLSSVEASAARAVAETRAVVEPVLRPASAPLSGAVRSPASAPPAAPPVDVTAPVPSAPRAEVVAPVAAVAAPVAVVARAAAPVAVAAPVAAAAPVAVAAPGREASLAETAVPPAVALRRSAPPPSPAMPSEPPGSELARALQLLAEADLEPAPRREPLRAEPAASVPNRHTSAEEAPPEPKPTPSAPVHEAPFVEAPPPSRVFGSRPPPLPLIAPESKPSEPEPTPVVGAEAQSLIAADERAVIAVAEPLPDEFSASVYEPEATPFLGSWPGLAPVVTAARTFEWPSAGDHDTERLPPVAFDDEAPTGSDFPDEIADDSPPMEISVEEAVAVDAIDGAPVMAMPEVLEEVPSDVLSRLDVPAQEPEDIAAVPVDVPAEQPEEHASSVDAASVAEPEVAAATAVPEAPIHDVASAAPLFDAACADCDEDAVSSEPASDEDAVSSEPASDEDVVSLDAPSDEDAVSSEPASDEDVVSLDAPSDEDVVSLDAPSDDVPDGRVESGVEEPAVVAEAAAEPAPSAPVPDCAAAEPAPASPPPKRFSYQPRRSDVSELLAGFAVAESRSLRDVSRELKRMADVAGTPCPPAVAFGGPTAGHEKAAPKKTAAR